MKLASFDIFDTVLIRKCGAAENIFYLLARKLYPDNAALREAFLLWRRTAPSKLKPDSGKVEVSLESLYSGASFAGFTQYSADGLIEKELETESENLIVNSSIRELVDSKRKSGYSIAFISDMYLPESFLRDVLKRERCLVEGDYLFVSSSCDARKDTGELFRCVKKQLAPEKWEHFGDNRKSDVKIPRRLGIIAKHIDSEYTGVEKECVVAAKQSSEPYTLKILAGMSRALRLSEGNSAEDILAADYVASSYLPYVHYLKSRCCERKIKRLYFLSRDGWILHHAAEKYGFEDVEFADLFVSRRSLMLPYLYCDFSPEAYLKIVDKHTLIRRNVSHMLWQLDLSREQVAAEFDCTFDYEKITCRAQEKDFLNKLFTGKLGEYLKQETERQYELAVGYFRQAGLFDDIQYAMVDVGWLGTSRLMLNTILRKNQVKDPLFFYYGVRRDVFPVADGVYETFFRDDECRTDAASLIEHYFSASYFPSTVRYERCGDEFKPVWEDNKTPTHNSITLSNSKIIANMANEIMKLNPDESILREWAKLCQTSFFEWKNKIDVTPLAKCGGMDTYKFCQKLTLFQITKIICLGARYTECDRGSLILSVGHRNTSILWYFHRLTYGIRVTAYRVLRKAQAI